MQKNNNGSGSEKTNGNTRSIYPCLHVEAELVSAKKVNTPWLQCAKKYFEISTFSLSWFECQRSTTRRNSNKANSNSKYNHSSSGGRHLFQCGKERRLDIITAAAAWHKQMAGLDVEAELVSEKKKRQHIVVLERKKIHRH